MKYILYTLIVIGILISLHYVTKYYNNINIKKVSGGTLPNQSDIDCASGGTNTVGKMIIGNCTKPVIYPVDKPMREKCFTSEELGLNEGDTGPDKVTDQNGFGATWFFNYQSGDHFCYRTPEFYK